MNVGMFLDGFKWLQHVVHLTAIEKGWWQQERNNGECIALMHSELSEALEGLRAADGIAPSDKLEGFLSVEEEFADTIIRIMDLCERRNWRLADAIAAKLAYNETRAHRHGGKAF